MHNVHIGFEDATAPFAVWLRDDSTGEYVQLASSDGAPLDIPLADWRLLSNASPYDAEFTTSVRVTAAAPGSATLVFRYWTSVGGRFAEDTVRQGLTAVAPPVRVDVDRDNDIDATDAQSLADGAIFRFWCNDDTDKGDYIGQSGDATPNAGNLKVDGKLDLVNFFPVQIDVSAFRRVWGNNASFKIRAPWSSGIWHCAVVNGLSADATDSLQTESQTVAGGAALDSADLVDLDWTGLDLGDVLRPDGTAMLAFEATRTAQADDGPELVVSLGDAEVFTYRLAAEMSHVDDMFRFGNLRAAAENPAFVPNVPALQPKWDQGRKDIDVFFTHGFNVSLEDARKWGRILFKRFWHSGFNARFHMLTWEGNYSLAPGETFNGLHYQHDVWYAQRTGGALKRYVEAAQPDSSKRILMTQSLGNMVACEALREGLHVGQYYMFDAAVQSEAIDGTLRAETSVDEPYTKYVPEDWRGYTNACWAANWHRLFAGVSNDARAQMGWTDRFQGALGNATEVYNYYSSGDAVFAETGDVPALLDDAVHWGLDWFLWVIPYPTVEFTFENHCWQKQEVLKGMATVAGTLSGGWGFNVWQEYDSLSGTWRGVRYSQAGAAAAVNNGSITNRPAFDVSGAAEMINPNATDDDVFLALAKHVPALSSPVGGSAVRVDEIRENINMNDTGGVPCPNGWGRPAEKGEYPWKHSDMKDMAYFYVYKLYEQLIQKGDLK